MDGLLMFFLVGGLYAYWKSWTRQKWLLLSGLLFGLAIMTKSAAGLFGPAIIVIDIIACKRWQLLHSRYFWIGAAAFLCVVAPWHIAQTLMHGAPFWSSYIGFQVVGRTFTQIFPTGFPWYWYAGVIIRRLFPFSFFFPAALLFVFRDIIRGKRDHLFILMWAILPLFAYSIAITKFEQYILIVYPAIAWCIARLFVAAIDQQQKDRFARIISLVSLMLLVFFFARYATPQFLFNFFKSFSHQTAYLLLGICSLGVGAVYICIQKSSRLFSWVTACLLAFFFLISFGRNFDILIHQQRRSLYQDIAEEIKAKNATRVVIFDSDLYLKPAGYFEIAKFTKEIVVIPKDMAWKIRHRVIPGSVFILSSSSDFSVAQAYVYLKTIGTYTLYYARAE
jgi:4-amino-4-deoxy-L-arabinose transferase-like glycosyltransferase